MPELQREPNPCRFCGEAHVFVNRHGASVACGCHWFAFRADLPAAVSFWNNLHPRRMTQLALFRDAEHP